MVLLARAQEPDQVPLRHWPAPSFWQPPLDSTIGLGEHAQRAAPTGGKKLQARNDASAGQPRQAVIAGGLAFVAITPCRIMDTRAGQPQTGQFGTPMLFANAQRNVNPTAHPTCGVPPAALAYSLNFTALSGPLSYLTVWPAGAPFPGVSTLNSPNGGIVANAAIVPAGTAGAISLFASDNADLIIDINGYYSTPLEFTEVSETLLSLTPALAFSVTVQCPLGKRVTSGSCFAEGVASERVALAYGGVADNQIFLWQCRWLNTSASSSVGTFVFYAGAWCSL